MTPKSYYIRSNKEIFEELLCNYKKQKADHEQKEEVYKKAYDAWWAEVVTNGDYTEKATALGTKLDNVTLDKDESEKEYNFLAHQVLRYYLLLDEN